ncbi:hypothetical protein [Massilia alkalitolerans]|uniref:hypothetical protein n=1 Tax=Massilia alkalitolerans TaxID=286638 RepID=UPI001E409536|nr:hypothetical protein [Massilia alkalitolerans]
MFLDDPRRFFQFAETTRYNAQCTGGAVRPSPLSTSAKLQDHHNHQRHSLFNDEDMTNSTGAPEPSAGSRELLLPWRRIARHLCPLIGESGFCALFGRAVHVIGPDHAWLAPQQPCRAPEQLFTSLEERMALVDAERAAAANEALLQTFTQLLAALIGERLTQRLLESASATTDTAPGQQKNAQEQK